MKRRAKLVNGVRQEMSGIWEELGRNRTEWSLDSNPFGEQPKAIQQAKPVWKRKIKEPKPIKRTKDWELYPSNFDETIMISQVNPSNINVKNKRRKQLIHKKGIQNLAQISPILAKQWVTLPENKQGKKKIRPKKNPW